MNELKQRRMFLREESKNYGRVLVEVFAKTQMDSALPTKAPKRRWRSREFLVQLFVDTSGLRRLSVNRTELNADGGWKDGITWDDLQRLKHEAGFGDVQAIEFYPPHEHIVRDCNIRHLFLMDDPLPFCWTSENRYAP